MSCPMNQMPSSHNAVSPVPKPSEFVRFFLSAIRPWRWIYAGIFVSILFATVAGYVLPILQKRLINALTARESSNIWVLFCIAGLLMLFVRSEALLRQRIVNSAVHKVMFMLKSRISDRLFGLPSEFLDRLGGDYLSSRLNTDISQLQFFSRIHFSQPSQTY